MFANSNLDPECNVVSIEKEVLSKWKSENTFKKTHEASEGRKEFSFYDGPPFATGLPHYGHLLAGTIKDVMTRFAYATGHCVERRFGWDCHGLPIEYEIDKELGISGEKAVMEMGLGKYNDTCKSVVMKFAKEWESTVARTGRWIDFENCYRTMDLCFMESVWWGFNQLFEQGRIYKAFKVMPYSTACTTPVSAFECNDNYKDIQDPSVVVTFHSVGLDKQYLAWTTTPWTLYSNLALVVNPGFDYLEVLYKEVVYVLAECRFEWLRNELKAPLSDFKMLRKYKGKDLVGCEYIPIFPHFQSYGESGAFRIVADTYVQGNSGTGIVHCAPAFGEDDFRVCVAKKIVNPEGPLPCPIDGQGKYTSTVPEHEGVHVKAADPAIKKILKQRGMLLVNSAITHSYPHCWRSDTPLIYMAVSCWFLRVKDHTHELLEHVEASGWVPTHVKDKQFHHWLSNAGDWCFSRNRFWGTPVPLWVSEDGEIIKSIGSIKDLETASGVGPITDLHRQFIDPLEIPDPRGSHLPPLKRIKEVFDCWWESGSMPFAHLHYPFENEQKFKDRFPADFIAEGVDQTRGWFYSLLVLSSGIFKQCPYKNVIVNGLVLTKEGQKMSKRLRNYTAPEQILDKLGADALRVYLITSPAVRGAALRFSDAGVQEVVKDVLHPWYHSVRFFMQEVTRLESQGTSLCRNADVLNTTKNTTDEWIISKVHNLVQAVRTDLSNYYLSSVVPPIIQFLDLLTNWYVRLNRDRMRDGDVECLQVLYEILVKITTLMAPLTPFMSEKLYGILKEPLKGTDQYQESVHYLMLPEVDMSQIKSNSMAIVDTLKKIIILGRTIRDKKNISIKTPLKSIRIFIEDSGPLADIASYVQDELHVMEVHFSSKIPEVVMKATPNFRTLGKKLGTHMGEASKYLSSRSSDEIKEILQKGSIEISGHEISTNDIIVTVTPEVPPEEHLVIEGDNDLLVEVDISTDENLKMIALGRELSAKVMKMRKEAKLVPSLSAKVVIEDNLEINNMLNTVSQNHIPSNMKRSCTGPEIRPSLEGCSITDTWTVGAVEVKVGLIF